MLSAAVYSVLEGLLQGVGVIAVVAVAVALLSSYAEKRKPLLLIRKGGTSLDLSTLRKEFELAL